MRGRNHISLASLNRVLGLIIEGWERNTNPDKTLSWLEKISHSEWKNISLHMAAAEIDFRDEQQEKLYSNFMRRYMELIRRIAAHRDTDPKRLIELLNRTSPRSNRNLINFISQKHDWTNVDRFVNVLETLAKREDVKEELLSSILTTRYCFMAKRKKEDDIEDTTNLTADLVCNSNSLYGSSHLLVKYLDLILKMQRTGKLSDETLCVMLKTPATTKLNIGELIAKYHTNITPILQLAELLSHLQPHEFIQFLPTKYNAFRNYATKLDIVETIKGLAPQSQVTACSNALNINHPLGYLMHMQRGVRECSVERGTLNDIALIRASAQKELNSRIFERDVEQRRPITLSGFFSPIDLRISTGSSTLTHDSSSNTLLRRSGGD
jgi:hypothetical protein